MDEKAFVDIMEDFKAVSEYITNDTPNPLGKYLYRSGLRLDVARKAFEKCGLQTTLDTFKYSKKTATNGIFRKTPKHPNQIWFVAHHDYPSAYGIEDDVTGLAVMIALAQHFKESKIEDHLVYASFDLEEYSLAGSKHFAKNLTEEERNRIRYVISLECLGSGPDITICKTVIGATSDPGLVQKLKIASHPYNFIPEDFNFFWADHKPFEDLGIKTAEISSLDHAKFKENGSKVSSHRDDGSTAHTDRDTLGNIEPQNLLKVYNTLVKFVQNEYDLLHR